MDSGSFVIMPCSATPINQSLNIFSFCFEASVLGDSAILFGHVEQIFIVLFVVHLVLSASLSSLGDYFG